MIYPISKRDVFGATLGIAGLATTILTLPADVYSKCGPTDYALARQEISRIESILNENEKSLNAGVSYLELSENNYRIEKSTIDKIEQLKSDREKIIEERNVLVKDQSYIEKSKESNTSFWLLVMGIPSMLIGFNLIKDPDSFFGH